MSVVTGKTKSYKDYNLMLGKICGKLSESGKEIPEGRAYTTLRGFINKVTFHIGNSTVVLSTREIFGKKTYFDAEAVVLGNDHEAVGKSVLVDLDEVGIRYLKIKKYVPKSFKR